MDEIAEQQYGCFKGRRTQNVCTVNTLSDHFPAEEEQCCIVSPSILYIMHMTVLLCIHGISIMIFERFLLKVYRTTVKYVQCIF